MYSLIESEEKPKTKQKKKNTKGRTKKQGLFKEDNLILEKKLKEEIQKVELK